MKTSHTLLVTGATLLAVAVLHHAFNRIAEPPAKKDGHDRSLIGTRIKGPATVHDGDTIRIVFNGQSHSIRIFGVDAPELDQTCHKEGQPIDCGITAREAMKSLIGTQQVTCLVKDIDRFLRMVAMCEAGGRDLGGALVRLGAVFEYARYSGGIYRADEDYAKARKLGLWGMTVESPAHYRACHSRDPSRPRPLDCLAK